MPRHLHISGLNGRRVTVAVLGILLAAALILSFIAFYGSRATPTTSVAGSGMTGATAGTGTPASSRVGAAQIPAEPAAKPTTAAPTPPPVVNPATGRVDTLNGLVPDYTLPPVENGMVPVLTRIPTQQNVVFLTIDDGAVKRDADLQLLTDNGIKATLFLAQNFIADQPDFYQQYLKAGHLIENHTVSHNLGFLKLGYATMKAEICGMSDFEEAHYGRRPVLMRPPGGPYSNAARHAAAECGIRAIVDWEAKANAGGMDYQVGAALRPGDIVLMHFRPEFTQDLAAFIKAQKAAGLKVVLLEDYLGVK